MEFSDRNSAHHWLLDQWKAAVDRADFERAVSIDATHYNELVKRDENSEYWDRWQSDTYAYRHLLASQCEARNSRNMRDGPTDGLLVVFPNFSGLAHEAQVARNLLVLRERYSKLEVTIVYLFGYSEIGASAAASLYKIDRSKIHFLRSKNYLDAGSRLNSYCELYNFKTILYPSIYYLAFWMSIFVEHSNQKFKVMKYFPRQAGRFSGWACGRKNRDRYYAVNGENFRQLSVLKLSQRDTKSGNFVSPTSESVVKFGSISRVQKISGGRFNEFVRGKLLRHDNVSYLVTCRQEELNLLPAWMRVNKQVVNLGWVEPVKSISTYDLYLESFPWGGGDMALLALESGIPYLTLDTAENRRTGMFDFLSFISESGSDILKYSFCNSEQLLSARFDELALSRALRVELGSAWARAISEYAPVDIDDWADFLGVASS